ncbi:exonuclease 1-like [Montipora capricornis]|uniref:exonuclease 1-like n=1 Tax=Montipora capricornis TaxID=246305 RepID=UPI0035F104ED
MVAEGNKLRAVASGVEHSMVLGFIEICRQKSIDYVVAPYEADAELAFLLKQGHADFVISEDSDLLAYGCKKEYAINLALGNVNPLDSNTVKSTFQLPRKEGLWQEKRYDHVSHIS